MTLPSRLRSLAALAVVLSCGAGLASAAPARQARAGFPLGLLLPDSEVVYGPTLYGFDTARFVEDQGGYLAGHAERVGDETLTGAQVIERIAEDYSVGPRLLLALVESESGWVRDPQPAATSFPVGGSLPGLRAGLSAAADILNRHYYGYRDGQRSLQLADGGSVEVPDTNAGTFALLGLLARDVTAEEWPGLAAPTRFYAAWTGLFEDDGYWYQVAETVPETLPQLEMGLPFRTGEVWYFVTGPHGGWGPGSARAAIDFAPPPADATGCHPSGAWVTAASAGTVIRSRDSGVAVNVDDIDFEGAGWVHVYSHLSPVHRVEAGTRVEAGDFLGYPSCAGGLPTVTRVAFARKYNGEWIPADEPRAPLVLSGWLARPGEAPGTGTLARPGLEPRTASTTKRNATNGVAALP